MLRMIPRPGDPLDAALVRAAARRKLFGEDATPLRLARFVLERRLASGTMGVVYAARDPELDRAVAIKVLHRDAGEAEGERLQAEAQSLARLRHPNIVAVYELGTWEGHLFLAMEYVEGRTLRAWLAERSRRWREVIELLSGAARGLAEAHRAGIVHRDFKPDNVLVGKDGDVRVVDFGLARAARAPGGAAGGFAGTPGYAAPECLQGRPADARSDQYSFCVTLKQALFGAGRAPAATGRVPARVRRLVARGLSHEPGARFASMDELLAALNRDPLSLPRRWAPAVALATIAVAATFAATRGSSTDDVCDGRDHLVGVWDDAARREVSQAFARTRLAFAEDAHRRAATRLDAYAEEWLAAHRAACRATRVTSEQSEELLDRRMDCLSRRLRVVAELVEILRAPADADTVRQAAAATHRLPELSSCADLRALRERIPPPEDAATLARVEALRARLARAEALVAAGRLLEAGRLGREIVDEARAVGHPPLLAEALILFSASPSLDPDPLDRLLVEAGRAGAEAHDDDVVARAWIKRMMAVGYSRGDHAAALQMRPFAEAAVARAGHDDVLEALLRNVTAVLLDESGRHEEAQRLFRETLALRERAYGPEHPEVAAVLSNLGDSHRLAGDYAAARDYLERSLAILRKTLGPYHPAIAPTALNLGEVFLDLGDLARARAMAETALQLYREIYPEDPPNVLAMLGTIAAREGRVDEGVVLLERALGIAHRTQPEQPVDGDMELQLGATLAAAGRWDEAIPHLERASAILDAVFGPDHPKAATARDQLGAARAARAGKAKAETSP